MTHYELNDYTNLPNIIDIMNSLTCVCVCVCVCVFVLMCNSVEGMNSKVVCDLPLSQGN